MATISKPDALALAATYASFAEDLVEYQADHGGDDDVDQAQLATMVSAVTQHSRTLANDAVATAFNDAAAAVQQLQKVTEDAKTDLGVLSGEVKKYTRVADITAGIINIGVGLATHNPTATIKAAVNLATSVAKDK
jgi:hypothetical protein